MKLTIHRPEVFQDPPQAVLIDTDNTLYPYEPAHRAAMKMVQEKAAQLFNVSPKRFEEAYHAAREQVKQRLKGAASSHSRLLYFQRMLELMGLGSQVLLALDLEQTYWRTFLSNARLFEGVRDFLEELRIAGIPSVVVTDLTAQIQFRKIVYFGLDHYFDFIVTSEEAGYDKPHSEPFRLAVEKMQAAGKCVWMVGDNPVNDIEGARKTIGAVTLLKVEQTVRRPSHDAVPDGEFSSYVELTKLLRKLLGEQAWRGRSTR